MDRAPPLLWWLIGLSLAVRLVFAWVTPLGVDEAYAVAVARHYSLSFYDHPPLGFWLPVLAADLTGLEHPLVYRAPAMLLFTLTTWLFWRLGCVLGGPEAGLWSAGLLTLAPAALLGAGVMVLPDGPLLAASAAMALALFRAVERPGSLGLWVLAGAFLALALAAKYHAALLPLGFLLWALLLPGRRGLLARPGPWLAAAIGLVGLVPSLAWNAHHDWASFAFHGGRTAAGLAPGTFLLMLLGQAVYLLPPILVAAALALWQALRKEAAGLHGLLAALALGPVVVFNLVYLTASEALPHWTMPGWLLALPLAGSWLANRGAAMARWGRWIGGFALGVALLLGGLAAHLRTGWLTARMDPLPPWDRTLDAFDWSGLGPALEARGLLGPDTVLASDHWIAAGQLATGLGGRRPMRVLGPNPHHFAYLPGASARGEALLILPAMPDELDRRQGEALVLAHGFDPDAEVLAAVALPRGQRDYARVVVVRLVLP